MPTVSVRVWGAGIQSTGVETAGKWSVTARALRGGEAVAEVSRDGVHEVRVRARRERRGGVPGWAYYEGLAGLAPSVKAMVFRAIERL